MSNPANFIAQTGLLLALMRAFLLLTMPLLLRWPVTDDLPLSASGALAAPALGRTQTHPTMRK